MGSERISVLWRNPLNKQGLRLGERYATIAGSKMADPGQAPDRWEE